MAVMAISCDKDNPGESSGDGKATQADLVGTWEQNGSPAIEFKADGSYKELGENSSNGTWSLNNTKINFTSSAGEKWEAEYDLTGGKAWLALIFDDEDGRFVQNYRKSGAKVESAKLTDGRWDAPRRGKKPEAYTKDVDYSFCMVIKGENVDLYVPAWGYHIQGTFTFSDGRMHINTDDDHIWAGNYLYKEDEDNWYFGWSMSGSPLDEDDKPDPNYDHSYGSMNAETFELQSPYSYYSVSAILAMGVNPKEHQTEYNQNPWQFKFRIYEIGENIRDIAKDLCDFEICVASNGTEAYGGAVGISPWLYKR